MTHTQDIAVLKDILDFFKDTRSKGELDTINRAIAHFTALDAATGEQAFIDIVFDGPPEHESGRFVEVEDMAGKSIKSGKWVHREDSYWVLRIPDYRAAITALAAAEARVRALTEALNYIAACCPVNESTEHIITRATTALKEAGQ